MRILSTFSLFDPFYLLRDALMIKLHSMPLSCLFLLLTAFYVGTFAYTEESWIPLNESYPGAPGAATCISVGKIICDKEGVLHAAGQFITVSGDTVNGIVRRDEDDWKPLGKIKGSIRTFTFDTTGNLYAAGDFRINDSDSAVNFAKWNGKTWSSFGGLIGSNYSSVKTLVIDSIGNIYAGGSFKKIGQDSANNIAFWDGSRWNSIKSNWFSGDSSNGVDGLVNAIAFTKTSMAVGGNFTVDFGKNQLESIGYWQDISFKYFAGQGCSRRDFTTGDIVVATVYDIAVSANREKIWVGGNFIGLDGWTNYGLGGSSGGTLLGPSSAVTSLEPLGNSGVFICGSLSINNPYGKPTQFPKIMYHGSGHPDFTTYMLSNGPDGTVSEMAYDSLSNSLYISGSFKNVGGKHSPKIARFQLDLPSRAAFPAKKVNTHYYAMLAGRDLILSGIPTGDYRVALFSLNGRQLFLKDIELRSGKARIGLPFKAEGSFICKITPASGRNSYELQVVSCK